MHTYPIKTISLEDAKKLQFKLVDTITKHFRGNEILSNGDLGVVMGLNKPRTTLKVEETISDFFGAEASVLLRGAGTGAIRFGIMSIFKNGDTILVHDAPIYPTTKITIESMGLKIIKADFNDISRITDVVSKNKIDGVLIQHTRQKPDDRYDLKECIKAIKSVNENIPVIIDDNYAVMKVPEMGIQCGADLSAFSLFKLLGPEGAGCVIGSKKYIDQINKLNYSGGGQVQGHEAMEALRGLIYVPVMLAVQGEVNDELMQKLNNGEIKYIKNAFIANAQSRVLLVEFTRDIADEVLKTAEELGAAPNPVGAESKYEFVPMFYRVSGTFRSAEPGIEKRMIRINPMRSGADTVIRILKEAIERLDN